MSAIPSWIGTQVADHVGRAVGSVCDVYYDEASSRAAWLLVDLRERLALVPTDGALSWSDRVVVPHDRELIDAAPPVATPPGVVSGDLLLRLARHYGVRVDRCAGYAAVHGGGAAQLANVA
jgi:sporulation protein YlmC with PRC-barrel domain